MEGRDFNTLNGTLDKSKNYSRNLDLQIRSDQNFLKANHYKVFNDLTDQGESFEDIILSLDENTRFYKEKIFDEMAKEKTAIRTEALKKLYSTIESDIIGYTNKIIDYRINNDKIRKKQSEKKLEIISKLSKK